MGIDESQAPRIVHAVIPDAESMQLVLEAGQLPSAEWRPGDGSIEQTLARIGQRVIGQAFAVDWAHVGPHGTIYLAKAVTVDALSLGQDVVLAGFDVGRERYDSVQKFWRAFIADVAATVTSRNRETTQ